MIITNIRLESNGFNQGNIVGDLTDDYGVVITGNEEIHKLLVECLKRGFHIDNLNDILYKIEEATHTQRIMFKAHKNIKDNVHMISKLLDI